MTREQVIEIRDRVRELRTKGMSFEGIGEFLKLPCGETEAVCYALDAVLSEGTEELKDAIEAVIADDSEAVRDYCEGKKSALGPLIGWVRKLCPHADARIVRSELEKRLTTCQK